MHTEAAGTAPPDAFGPYRVLHQVGAGTLGPVFRAYDVDQARLVAVKVLRLDVPPERMHQLVAELERLIAAELAHPVIAAPIATGTDGLVMYFVQEYVPADSLDVVLRDEGPPDPADALRVAAQLAGALDFAAARKVYHGVLHPRDVLIAQDDTRLTGLGLADAIERIGVAAPRRRPYTAPERMAGARWGRRADVFSLAALIHEMLWGRRLTAIGAEAAGALTNLPGADLARLKAAFARALAPDPADRFEIAMDFATALKEAFPSITIRDQAGTAPQARLPLEPDLGNGLESRSLDQPRDRQHSLEDGDRQLEDGDRQHSLEDEADSPLDGDAGRAGLEFGTTSDDGLRAGRGHAAPITDDLELRAAADSHYDEVEIAPTIRWDQGAVAAEPAITAAAREGKSPEDVTLIGFRNSLDRDADSRDDDDGTDESPTVTAAVPRPPLFQPYQVDSSKRLDTREEPYQRARSVVAPVAAALIAGLALGFAGGYALGGRRGAPVVASRPAATAPSPSAKAPARPGREFTEAAVGEGVTVGSQPAPGARPSPALQPGRGQAGTRPAVPGPGTTRPTVREERDAAAAPAAPVTAPGRLLVRSTPAGARVFVDGREQGQTPATIRELAPGTHRVRVARDGYVAEERRIAITAAKPIQSMTVDLKQARAPGAARAAGTPAAAPATVGASRGALTVDSRPDGAKVFLDGQLVGTTPLSLPQIAEGEHAVRLELDGYRRWSSSVRVAGGQRQRVAASLER